MKMKYFTVTFISVFFSLALLSQTILITGIDDTALPTSFNNPVNYTLGVQVGDEKIYVVEKAFRILPNIGAVNNSFWTIFDGYLALNQELKVKIIGIENENFFFDILLKGDNGEYHLEKTYSVSRKYYINPDRYFLTTTNQTLLENILNEKTFSYEIKGKVLNVTRRSRDFYHSVFYDLKTGFLIRAYQRSWNSEQVLSESEILMKTTAGIIRYHFSFSWSFWFILIILGYRKFNQ